MRGLLPKQIYRKKSQSRSESVMLVPVLLVDWMLQKQLSREWLLFQVVAKVVFIVP